MPSTQAAVPGRVAWLSHSRAGSSSPPAKASGVINGVTYEPIIQQGLCQGNAHVENPMENHGNFPKKMIHQWLGYPTSMFVCVQEATL